MNTAVRKEQFDIVRNLTVTVKQLRRARLEAVAKYGLNACEISILTCLMLSPAVSSIKTIEEYFHSPMQ